MRKNRRRKSSRKRRKRRRKRRKKERERRRKEWHDYHAPFIQIRPLKKSGYGPTDGRTNGWTKPLIEMLGRI